MKSELWFVAESAKVAKLCRRFLILDARKYVVLFEIFQIMFIYKTDQIVTDLPRKV